MVRGLDIFREWFAKFPDQYILIGGTAATLAMEEAGLDFRATKDVDVVLVVEALTPAFGETFWAFIEAGGYQVRQSSSAAKPTLYRFQKPSDDRFPAMVELFARAPDALRPADGARLAPIPFGEAVASLSAILLDDDYYAFILRCRRDRGGLPWVGEDCLIPLKAVAWLELGVRRESGESVDASDVRKHVNDVLRLSQLLTEATRIPLQGKVAADMRRFLEAAAGDATLDPKALGLGRISLGEVLARVARAYGLDPPSSLSSGRQNA